MMSASSTKEADNPMMSAITKEADNIRGYKKKTVWSTE
jgi:hypothetical protein